MSVHIDAQSSALLDYSSYLQTLTDLHNSLRQDLINLEQHYSLAVEKSNLRAMSTQEVRLRIGWQIQEIKRINDEKERALHEAERYRNECLRLGNDLQGMGDLLVENAKLKQENSSLRQRIETSESDVANLMRRLQIVENTLRKPSRPMVRLRERFLIREKENVRGGFLIPGSPTTSIRQGY